MERRGRRPTGGSSAGRSGVVPAASVVTHVLHAHTAPDAQHEALNVTLVGATHDAEVAPLAPVWAPRVGGSLGTRRGGERRQGSGARRSPGLREGASGCAGTHPVFERPSIRQSLLSPPAGQSRGGGRARALSPPAFRGSTPGPSPSVPLFPLVAWGHP